MNPRTITHNDQLDQLIGALQPKAEKPAPLSSTWPILHEKAMATAKIANEHCWPNDPPDDGICALVIVLIIGAIKDALTAKGVDMTGIIPSDYDDAVASIVCAAEGNAVEADVTAGKTFSNATSTGLTGTRAPAMIQASGQAGTDAGGVAYPSPRFVDNGDGTITDKLTGLMWAKNLNLAASDFGRYASWTEAKATCEGKNIGGHTDWRLPNNKEIDSLLNWSGFPLSNYLALSGFTNSAGHSLWTNTVAQNNTSYAFWVSSNNGVRNADVKTALYGYVPVRGPIAL